MVHAKSCALKAKLKEPVAMFLRSLQTEIPTKNTYTKKDLQNIVSETEKLRK
jgi:hypothetical protein